MGRPASMTPKPGTKADIAILFIKHRGVARSSEIAAACEMPQSHVASTLGPYVDKGVLICCKVSSPGKPDTNEYRIGAGITSRTQVPELQFVPSKTPQRTVGQNIRSGPSAPPMTPPAEGTAVANRAPIPSDPTQAAKPGRDGARNEIRLSIDDDARLSITLADGQSDPLRLTPEETLALGDFLVCTQQLWRP